MASRPRLPQRLRPLARRSRTPPVAEEPHTDGAALDAFAASIRLDRLTDEQCVQLLDTWRMLSEAGAGVSMRSMSTATLVDLIATASKTQLRTVSMHPRLRPFLLEEIFRRMSEHLVAEKVADIDVAVGWRFTDAPDGEVEEFQTVIATGTCQSGTDLDRQPDTTMSLAVYDFIRIATGLAAAAPTFMRGRIKVKGDYALAVTFSSYFDIPGPSRAC